jgi:hypothetical protein
MSDSIAGRMFITITVAACEALTFMIYSATQEAITLSGEYF